MLSMYAPEQDVTEAEFVRLYGSATFPGRKLLEALEAGAERKKAASCRSFEPQRTLPAIKEDFTDTIILLASLDDVYGYRPKADDVFYLSPCEFVMWWYIEPKGRITPDVPAYHEFPDYAYCQALRAKYWLVRQCRPVVPSPSNTPMPDAVPLTPEHPGQRKESQGKLYSVYMRPWTKIPEFATDHVPLLWNLDRIPYVRKRRIREKQSRTSFSQAWSWYLHGHNFSKHHTRVIHQIMLMNCGRSTTDTALDLDAAEQGSGKKFLDFDNKLCVQNVHAIVKRMLEQRSRESMDGSTVPGSMHTALSLGDELGLAKCRVADYCTRESVHACRIHSSLF